jgi:hypothetical protein
MSYHIAEWGRDLGPCLLIAHGPSGLWVVRDERRLCGGTFTNEADAIRFAMAECQRRPQSVLIVPDDRDCEIEPENPKAV